MLEEVRRDSEVYWPQYSLRQVHAHIYRGNSCGTINAAATAERHTNFVMAQLRQPLLSQESRKNIHIATTMGEEYR
jgi:hypothetical protein